MAGEKENKNKRKAAAAAILLLLGLAGYGCWSNWVGTGVPPVPSVDLNNTTAFGGYYSSLLNGTVGNGTGGEGTPTPTPTEEPTPTPEVTNGGGGGGGGSGNGEETETYNPLGLIKDDGLDGACVSPEGSITYNICYSSTANTLDVTNVVITDNLPPETIFVSATGGGTYDAGTHTVTWNLGTLGASQQCVQLNVSVTPDSKGTITNSATIDSDQTTPKTVIVQTTICGEEQEIPEFSTIAIPVAAILGLIFFFNHRKRRK